MGVLIFKTPIFNRVKRPSNKIKPLHHLHFQDLKIIFKFKGCYIVTHCIKLERLWYLIFFFSPFSNTLDLRPTLWLTIWHWFQRLKLVLHWFGLGAFDSIKYHLHFDTWLSKTRWTITSSYHLQISNHRPTWITLISVLKINKWRFTRKRPR